MELIIDVAVASEDGRIKKSAVSKLALATGIYGTDASVAKQDFLQQAESIIRTISENQIPALYDAVQKQIDAEPPEPQETPGQTKVRAKLKAIRDKRSAQDKPDADPDAQPDAQPEQEQEPAGDTVTCTACGATIPNDDAHYVSIVRNGKYDHDGVLCDECYKKELNENRKNAARGVAQ